MKKVVLIMMLIFGLMYQSFAIDTPSAKGAAIYVSKTGDDKNNGMSADLPFATISKAQLKAREIKEDYGISDGGITIYVNEGVYDGITITPDDSGYTNRHIKYKAVGDVTLKDTVTVPKDMFSVSKDSRIPKTAYGKVYEADVLNLLGTIDKSAYTTAVNTTYYRMFEKDSSLTLARYPNENRGVFSGDTYDYTTVTVSDEKYNVTTLSCEKQKSLDWENAKHAVVGGYLVTTWNYQNLPVAKISENKITLDVPPTYAEVGTKQYKQYFIYNLLEELNIPGEWFIDAENGKLYYYPLTEPTDVEIATSKTPVVSIGGAKNITLDGFKIEKTRDIGINLTTITQNINIINCKIAHIGAMGIKIGENCKNINIESCTINDIGGRGIHLTGGNRPSLTPANNIVKNCDIYNFGLIYRTYSSGVHIDGVGNSVINNKVHDSAHIGIYFNGNDHLIQQNELYNLTTEVHDSGVIYGGLDLMCRGTVIHQNYIHDIISPISINIGANTNAIYLDDLLSGTTVTQNITAHASRGLLAGGGKSNNIENNIFIDCTRFGMIFDDRGKDGDWFYDKLIKGGLVYNRVVKMTSQTGYDKSVWESKYRGLATDVSDIKNQVVQMGVPKNNVVKNNFFAPVAPEQSTAFLSISPYIEYSGSNVYNNNVISSNADDCFVDYNNNNFNQIQSSSLFNNIPEFQKIPFDEIGLLNGGHQVLQKPIITYPKNNGTTNKGTINIMWQAVDGGDEYEVVVSKNSDLSNPVYNKTTRNTGIEMTNAQGKYYYMVTAKSLGENDMPSSSEIYSFNAVYDIKMTNAYLTDLSDNRLNTFKTNTAVKAVIETDNMYAVDAQAMIVCKDKNSKVCEVLVVPLSFSQGKDLLSIPINLSKNYGEECSLCIYLWDTAQNAKPQTEQIIMLP